MIAAKTSLAAFEIIPPIGRRRRTISPGSVGDTSVKMPSFFGGGSVQARRAGDELANRVVVAPLAAGGRQGVQHGRFDVFEGRERQRTRLGASSEISTSAWATASFAVADSFVEGVPCCVYDSP